MKFQNFVKTHKILVSEVWVEKGFGKSKVRTWQIQEEQSVGTGKSLLVIFSQLTSKLSFFIPESADP